MFADVHPLWHVLQVVGNVARLHTDTVIENPSSCHSVSFVYSLSGSNPGRLSLRIQSIAGDNIRELWFTDTATGGWTPVQISFRYFDKFKVINRM